ncbi:MULTISPECIES: hypothetical protein [Hyphobacterium]|uniref:Uncharacterized protein n=1 Tax=Hyphobacterium vulgare TaxID=1736751 RepID=A0ABV6ZTI4_9PROT
MDAIAERTIWVVAFLAQIAGWSALIWWDYDFRQKLRYSRWDNNPALGIPFSVLYGVGYLIAFLVLPLIPTAILVGATVLIFKALGADVGF